MVSVPRMVHFRMGELDSWSTNPPKRRQAGYDRRTILRRVRRIRPPAQTTHHPPTTTRYATTSRTAKRLHIGFLLCFSKNYANDTRMLDLSIVIPVYNEEECIEQVCDELHAALTATGHTHEVILVNDGSTDETSKKLHGLTQKYAAFRTLRLRPNSGQSAALIVGFRAALGSVIITMDADGQNDPADIPRLLEQLDHCDMCCGYRAARQDTAGRKIGSRIANFVRNAVLRENIIDTGCTLKAVKADFVRDLAIWNGMHRFMPALASMKGAVIKQIPVNHRPRMAGRSKYTNLGRLGRTIWDLLAVRWMQKRQCRFEVEMD